jgi:L-seryl-tRNA(Ser) seleniumtransferase
MAHTFRAIPAVEKILQALGPIDLPRPAILAVVRKEIAALRKEKQIPEPGAVLARIRSSIEALRCSRLQPVINGTGILAHTNLGRVPLAPSVCEALGKAASCYSNVELDLTGGERGGRAAYLEHNLALLCAAEAATVVNNCAAALVLVLRHFTKTKKEVVISRGELVQIGGGFRIPEILEASGAILREVGTTNRTSLEDYERALGRETALILKVHRSNFFMGGFVESPGTEALASLARGKRLSLVEDLGSGAVMPTEQIAGLEHEPTPAEVLKKGVDLVTFSGDKLLGGPQAGIVAGRAKLVAALKREPFFRALRCDKLILAALQTTIDLHLSSAAEMQIPVLVMLRISKDELLARAGKILAALDGFPLRAAVGQGKAQIGGGTLPNSSVLSVTINLLPDNLALAEFAGRLRAATPPVIGYLSGGRFKLDMRTIFPSQDQEVVNAIRGVFRIEPGILS